MNENKPVKHGALWTVLFAVVSLFWIFPIVLVLINSFKQKAYISKNAFSLPAGGLVTDQMKKTVYDNIWYDSLVNWLKSFH